MRGLSLVAASGGHSSLRCGGHSSSRCAGLSLPRSLLLRSTGSRRAGSVVVAHGPSCSAAHGIFPDQGSNPCPLHWQADPQPLRHQGSSCCYYCFRKNLVFFLLRLKIIGSYRCLYDPFLSPNFSSVDAEEMTGTGFLKSVLLKGMGKGA